MRTKKQKVMKAQTFNAEFDFKESKKKQKKEETLEERNKKFRAIMERDWRGL